MKKHSEANVLAPFYWYPVKKALHIIPRSERQDPHNAKHEENGGHNNDSPPDPTVRKRLSGFSFTSKSSSVESSSVTSSAAGSPTAVKRNSVLLEALHVHIPNLRRKESAKRSNDTLEEDDEELCRGRSRHRWSETSPADAAAAQAKEMTPLHRVEHTTVQKRDKDALKRNADKYKSCLLF